MKTMYFRLLATILTLAAVTTAIQPVNAQRRSTGISENGSKEVPSRERADNIERKSTFRDEAIEKSETTREVSRSIIENSNRNSANNISESTRSKVADNIPDNYNDRRETSYSGVSRSAAKSTSTNSVSESKRNSRFENTKATDQKYYHNSSDKRYKPNDNYRGSRQNWSSEIRNQTFYQNKSNVHVNVNYWDKHWENYCWNQNSWVNYYGYYNPYTYRNYKYYYHHRYYGHVIRRFEIQPLVLMHAGSPYYYFEGNFFRYQKWVGYVLVDMEFGTIFDYLPEGYEMVYINGFQYYRFGNLFFENTFSGFQLVHYPERYYTFDSNYHHQGFSLAIKRF